MNAIRPVWVHVGPTSGGGELLDVAAAVGVVVTDAGDLSCVGPRVEYRVDVFADADPDRLLAVAFFDGPDTSTGVAAIAAVLARAVAVVAAHHGPGRYGDVFVHDGVDGACFYDTVDLADEAGRPGDGVR